MVKKLSRRQLKPESAALSRRAFKTDAPAHQFYQLLAEAKPRYLCLEYRSVPRPTD